MKSNKVWHPATHPRAILWMATVWCSEDDLQSALRRMYAQHAQHAQYLRAAGHLSTYKLLILDLV